MLRRTLTRMALVAVAGLGIAMPSASRAWTHPS